MAPVKDQAVDSYCVGLHPLRCSGVLNSLQYFLQTCVLGESRNYYGLWSGVLREDLLPRLPGKSGSKGLGRLTTKPKLR